MKEGGFAGDGTRRPIGRVAIVGAGQVGTMIGGALRAADASWGVDEVGLFDVDPSVAAESLARGGGDRILTAADEALAADAVVLAIPVFEIEAWLAENGGSLPPGALVIDTGGTKGPIVRAMARHVPPAVHAVGGHPMAGTEGPGPAAARPDLLAGATFVLTPARDDPQALAAGRALAAATGARAVEMDAGLHDRTVARISHLPHLVAFALASVAGALAAEDPDAVRALLGGGYRGATRLAAGDPAMIGQFCSANANELEAAVAELRSALDALSEAAARGSEPLRAALAEGRAAQALVLAEAG